MSTLTIVTIVLVLLLLALGVGIWAVAMLRKQPGLRRRREDPNYDGPPRRFTDCAAEVHAAFKEEILGEREKKDRGFK